MSYLSVFSDVSKFSAQALAAGRVLFNFSMDKMLIVLGKSKAEAESH